MPLIQISKPEVFPVTADEVKNSANVDGSEFDAKLSIIIPALTRRAESLTGRVFIARDLELVLNGFPVAEVDLQLPMVSSIKSVKYVDTAEEQQTLATDRYTLDGDSLPSFLLPARGMAWPETLATAGAVRIRFTAGYGPAAADVPEEVRLWIIAYAVQILENPDGMESKDLQPQRYVDGLLDDFRILRAS